MNVIVGACFSIILALLLFSVSFGLRFYEKQRRNKLVSMLRTVTENGEERHVNLLVDSNDKKDGIEDLLGSLNITDRIGRLLTESAIGWTLTRLFITMGVTFAMGAIGSMWIPISAPPFLRALAAGLCTGFLPVVYVSKKRTSRINALEAQLPDALDFLSRSMRAGHAFTISLEMVGEETAEPLGQEFRALFNEQNLGASLDRSFLSFSKRVPIPDIRFFCSAVLLQRRPQTGSVQLGHVDFHGFPATGRYHRLALVVHLQHQLGGMRLAVAEQLLEHIRHIGHQIDGIVPHDCDPWTGRDVHRSGLALPGGAGLGGR